MTHGKFDAGAEELGDSQTTLDTIIEEDTLPEKPPSAGDTRILPIEISDSESDEDMMDTNEEQDRYL